MSNINIGIPPIYPVTILDKSTLKRKCNKIIPNETIFKKRIVDINPIANNPANLASPCLR